MKPSARPGPGLGILAGFTDLRAASHLVDQLVAGNALLLGEYDDLVEINRIG